MSDCTTCAEYDAEKGFCPKYCEVIRKTVEELVEVVRCRDCYHFHIVNQPYDENWCTVMEGCVDPDGYCYKGEVRDDDTD